MMTLETEGLFNLLKDHMKGAAPPGSTPFTAVTTVITTTTAVEAKAAVTGKKHWITWAIVVNYHATEDTYINIQGSGDVVLASLAAPALDLGAGHGLHVFNPPLEVPAGEAVEGIGGLVATGDCFLTVGGYVEP
jgi:hypothetical protein